LPARQRVLALKKPVIARSTCDEAIQLSLGSQ
jgi:hypothetical protein